MKVLAGVIDAHKYLVMHICQVQSQVNCHLREPTNNQKRETQRLKLPKINFCKPDFLEEIPQVCTEKASTTQLPTLMRTGHTLQQVNGHQSYGKSQKSRV